MFKDLKFKIQQDSHDPLYIQLKDQVKDFILKHDFPKGTPLPSIKIIADSAGVTLQTAERGMTELIKEGVCYRRPKKGTFVDNICQKNEVTCVGIYFSHQLDADSQFAYYSTLHAQFCEQLTAMNIQTMVWMDNRPENEKMKGLPLDLIDAIDKKKIQYMFIGMGDWLISDYLKEKKLPFSSTVENGSPGVIHFDRNGLFRLAFDLFHQKSVKNIAFITNEAGNLTSSGQHYKSESICNRFMKRARENGFNTKFKWVKSAGDRKLELEPLGYELFIELWQEDEKPEGLFVFPDSVARGVVSAILKEGVRVPEELKLVFHKNREVNLFHPFPVNHVINTIKRVADAFIEQLVDYMNGWPVKPQTVEYEVE